MADKSPLKALWWEIPRFYNEEIEEHDLLAENTLDNSVSLLSVLNSLNKNMDRMASSTTHDDGHGRFIGCFICHSNNDQQNETLVLGI